MVRVPPAERDFFSDNMNQQNLASDIWNIADTLRGDFRQSELGRVFLSFAMVVQFETVISAIDAQEKNPAAGHETLACSSSFVRQATLWSSGI